MGPPDEAESRTAGSVARSVPGASLRWQAGGRKYLPQPVAAGETQWEIRHAVTEWLTGMRTLQHMKVRYRDPYNARHSSVSWNLMIGGNPLRVAKNHGHGVQTMLEVYAAWIEGAQESDVEAIREAMAGSPRTRPRAAVSASANVSNSSQPEPPQSPEFGTNLALERGADRLSVGKCRERTGGERGIRTLEGLLTLTPLAGVRLRPLGHLSGRANPLSCQ
jgi:hypothetical protein